MSGAEVRRDYINTHVVILQALGIAGRDLMEKYPDNWKKKLKKLKDIDWQKRNKVWDQRVIVSGRVVKNNKSIMLASNVIKKALGVGLNAKEKAEESKMKNGKY